MADEQQASIPDDTMTPQDNGPAVGTCEKTAPTRHEPKQLPPYKVLLHNDDVNTVEHVIKCILRLTTLAPQDAMLRTVEAHDAGVALLLVTHRERAELYQEQFASVSLTVTIEPDSA